jgi:polar amino acid transport system substrate-binding protein
MSLLSSSVRFMSCLSLLGGFCLSLPTQAETFTVLAYLPGNPPYNIVDGQIILGISRDLCEAIGKHSGDKFKFIAMPIARGLQEFDNGSIDIEPGVNPNWRDHLKIKGLYSIPYADSITVIAFTPGRKKPVLEPSDLFGDIVGMTRGFSFPRFDKAISAGLITRIDNLSQSLLIEQLYLGRLQQIFINRTTLAYFQKQRPEMSTLEIGDETDRQELMMRVHPNKAYLLPRMNEALLAMLASGEIDRIYAKYK